MNRRSKNNKGKDKKMKAAADLLMQQEIQLGFANVKANVGSLMASIMRDMPLAKDLNWLRFDEVVPDVDQTEETKGVVNSDASSKAIQSSVSEKTNST